MRTHIQLLFTLFFSIAFINIQVNAQSLVSIDVLSKMEKEHDFQTRSVIQRMINTQQPKVDDGTMTQFEAECIAINTVDMLGVTNADRFIRITERAFKHESPSMDDQKFIEDISQRYLSYMQLVANQCSQEDPDHKKEIEKLTQQTNKPSKNNEPSIIKDTENSTENHSSNEGKGIKSPSGFTLITPQTHSQPDEANKSSSKEPKE